MKTTIKVTKRQTGYTALVTYPWGAKVRLAGYSDRNTLDNDTKAEIDCKRAYTLDKDM